MSGYDSDKAYENFKKWYKAEKDNYDYTANYYAHGSTQRVARFTVTRRTGPLRVTKTSSTIAVTRGKFAYKLSGAKFGVFTDKACKKRYKTVTTDATGSVTITGVPTGKYWVKEEAAPKNYSISSTAAKEVTVTKGTTATVSFEDKPQTASAKLTKQTANTAYGTTGYYDLKGATYGLWEDRWSITNGSDGKAGTADDVLWGVNSSSADLRGVYEITTASGYCFALDANQNKKTAGTKIDVYPGNGTESQRWRLIKASGQGASSYYIENVTSGLRIGTSGKKTANGTNVCLVKAANSDKTQIWDVVAASSPKGTYVIKNRANTRVALTVPDGKPTNTPQLKVMTANGAAAQSWKLRSTLVARATTNSKGEMTFSNLIPEHTYYAREITPPTSGGYKMNYAVITVKAGAAGKSVSVTTKDNPVPPPTVTIGTKAVTGGKKTIPVPTSKTVTITDTVSYSFSGTLPKSKFTIKGTVMDKATKKALDAGGKAVTATATFTPKSAKGTCNVSFSVPTSAIEGGRTLVVYEELWGRMTSSDKSDKKVAEHKDLNDADQTVTFTDNSKTQVSISTTATVSGKKAMAIPDGAETVTVKDVVSYKFTMSGSAKLPTTQFTISGTLMDKATKQPFVAGDKQITATDTFVPDAATGTRTLEFVVPVASIDKTTSLVVFEEMTGRLDGATQDGKVAEHKNINDSNQTVKLTISPKPELSIRTIATVDGRHDASTESMAGDTVTITDRVMYEFDLNSAPLPQRTFHVRGTLMDKTTGERITNNDQPVEAQAEFTPSQETGETQVTFVVPKAAVVGKHVVVFESVYDSLAEGVDAVAEDDLQNMDQTVSFPTMGTTATDASTGGHQALAASGTTVRIDDVVAYSGLTPGNSYQVAGTLRYKESGEAVKVDGNDVTATQAFTADASSGTVTVTFSVPAELVAGHTVVAFEQLLSDGTEVAAHADINDIEQSVTYEKPGTPRIGTQARDAMTGGHSGIVASDTVVIADEVAYEDLTPGNQYWLAGTLMDMASKSPILVKADNGTETQVTATSGFEASDKSGTTTMEFSVPSEAVVGKSVVVFERLYDEEPTEEGATPIATHEDIGDAAQTVSYPSVRTSATDKASGTHDGIIQGTDVTIVDRVTCSGLVVGKEYVISGMVYDKATGQPLGAPAEQAGEQSQDGQDDGEGSQEAQGGDGTETGNDDSGDQGETPGATGPAERPSEATGTVTASRTFTATATSMVVELEFKVPSSLVAGKSAVVFESLQSDGTEVAAHANIDDLEQTVSYPYIGTVATDSSTSSHDGDASVETVTINDVVTYSGLIPGTTYTLTGTLMDKATGQPIPDATASMKFVAEQGTGSVTIAIPASGQSVLGKSVVVFEVVSLEGRKIATHEDINDVEQTVSYPSVSTTALYKDNGTKDAPRSTGRTEIVDRVEYKGLTPGVRYRIVGTLHDKAYEKDLLQDKDKADDETAGEVGFLLDDGGRTTQEFSPDAPDGHIDISFSVDIEQATNKDIVVFEVISRKDAEGNDVTVTTHEDLDAESQTVHGPIPETGPVQDKIRTREAARNTSDLASDLVHTGHTASAGAVVLCIAAISGIALVAMRRRQ